MKLNQLGMGAIRALGTACITRAILAINAASAATVRTTNAIVYTIDGIIYNRVALAAQALTAFDQKPFYVQPANTTVYYTLALDAAGNVRVMQGDFAGRQTFVNGIEVRGDGNVPDVPDFSVASTDAAGNQTLATQWCPFGIIRIATGAATFTPGTTALDAAGITATYFDVMYLPSAERP